MKINEFTNPLPLFVATVRAKTASSTSNLKTAIYAEGPSQAQQLLRASYGDDSVVCVNLSEAESAKPLTPDQLKLKSLSDQRLAASKNEQAERARQKMANAQKAVQQVSKPKPTVAPM